MMDGTRVIYLIGLKINWKYHFLKETFPPNVAVRPRTPAPLTASVRLPQLGVATQGTGFVSFPLSSVVFQLYLAIFEPRKSLLFLSLCILILFVSNLAQSMAAKLCPAALSSTVITGTQMASGFLVDVVVFHKAW